MTCPAVGSVIPRLAAMSGSRPIATNSVVPIPNPPRASASTASQRTEGAGATTEAGAVGAIEGNGHRDVQTLAW